MALSKKANSTVGKKFMVFIMSKSHLPITQTHTCTRIHRHSIYLSIYVDKEKIAQKKNGSVQE